MADLNDRLRNLRSVDAGEPTPVASLAARARARRRRRLGAAGLATVCLLGGALLVAQDGERRDEVAAVDDRHGRPGGGNGVIVPSLVDETVASASTAAEGAGLVARVHDTDADFPGAVVIAQEPGPGETVAPGSVVGLRTALPDTEEAQECPGTGHPHDEPATADPLPLQEQITRSAAERVLLDHDFSFEGVRLVLGTWDRFAYEVDADGEVTIRRARGFQVMALHDTVADCPVAPPQFLGVPLTRVVLERTDLVAPRAVGVGEAAGSWSAVEAAPFELLAGLTAVWTGDEILVVGGTAQRAGAGPDGAVDGSSVEYGPDGQIIEDTPFHEARNLGVAGYDPATGRWRRLPNLPFEPQGIEASTWTGDRLLLVADEVTGVGENGPDTEKRLLSLDPDEGGWRSRSVPQALGSYVWAYAEAFTGTEWVLWGYPYHSPESDPIAVAYDPGTDRWRTIDPGPLGFRELPGSTWTGEELIVFGGDTDTSYDIVDPPPGEGAAYDPASGRWRSLPPAPVPNLREPSLVWTGSEVLVWGGSFGPSNPTGGAAYDPATDSWRELAPSPLFGRNGTVAVWTGDRLVVTDGTPSYTSPNAGAGTAVYDPETDSWTLLADPPGGLACGSTGVATPHGIHVLGGRIACTTTTPPVLRSGALRLDLDG